MDGSGSDLGGAVVQAGLNLSTKGARQTEAGVKSEKLSYLLPESESVFYRRSRRFRHVFFRPGYGSSGYGASGAPGATNPAPPLRAQEGG